VKIGKRREDGRSRGLDRGCLNQQINKMEGQWMIRSLISLLFQFLDSVGQLI
jgi:hypothetical protein